MSAFRPADVQLFVGFAAALLAWLVCGFVLSRTTSSVWVPRLAWAVLVVGGVGIEALFASEPPGARMLVLIVFTLSTLKIIVVARERARGMPALSFAAWLGFSVAWLGMSPRVFTSYGSAPLEDARSMLRRGAVCFAIGAGFVGLARGVWIATESQFAATVPLLIGLSLLLHFGIGTFLAGAWRQCGVPVSAVFQAPLRSTSLAEFWSRRWNLGFSEMTAMLIYRPLSARVGRSAALIAGFVWSGLLHEMAISVPVRAGFGLPSLYFLLHGGLVWVERRLSKAGHPLSAGWGRAWSLLWVSMPLPLLFHPPFLSGVVWPLIGIH